MEPESDLPLTDLQRGMLKCIYDYFLNNRSPPTLRDLMLATGLSSPNSVVVHLKPLVKKGYITYGGDGAPGSSRQIRLLGVSLVIDDTEAGRRLRAGLSIDPKVE